MTIRLKIKFKNGPSENRIEDKKERKKKNAPGEV